MGLSGVGASICVRDAGAAQLLLQERRCLDRAAGRIRAVDADVARRAGRRLAAVTCCQSGSAAGAATARARRGEDGRAAAIACRPHPGTPSSMIVGSLLRMRDATPPCALHAAAARRGYSATMECATHAWRRGRAPPASRCLRCRRRGGGAAPRGGHACRRLRATREQPRRRGTDLRACSAPAGAKSPGTQNDSDLGRQLRLAARTRAAAVVAGSHGKHLMPHTDATRPDFCLRALILSFGDVDPMPDGPLYCCNFQSEADAGQCCTITITNAARERSGRQGDSAPAAAAGR